VAIRSRTAARPLPKQVLDPPSLARDAFHELANRLAMMRLTAHVEGRAQRGSAGAPLREIEEVAAHCGVLLTATRALVGRRASPRLRVSPTTLLDGLAGVLSDRSPDRVSVRVRRPRGVPDVRVDAELLHQLLLSLALGALEASRPRGKVELFARKVGREVILVLEDDAEPIDLELGEGEAPRAGRALGLRLASVLLARSGGRLSVAPRKRGNRIEVRLRAAAGRSVRQRA
jgi:C4-dicarboxylate-specific signal transduction histidine kinase